MNRGNSAGSVSWPNSLRRLSAVDIQAIIAAQAVDDLNEQPWPWWQRCAWLGMSADVAKSREAEIASHQRDRFRTILKNNGVEETHIDAYLARIPDGELAAQGIVYPPHSFAYPPPMPDSSDKAIRNTHFLLQCFSYDRGALLSTYGPDFDDFADLDPVRVGNVIESFYGSDDDTLQTVAGGAIAYIPGNRFVGTVLHDMVYNGHEGAWHALEHPDHPQETTSRLVAMIDLATETYGPEENACLWEDLRMGECSEPVCVEKAIIALEKVEPIVSTKKEAEAGDFVELWNEAYGNHERLAVALRRYLAEAKTRRQGNSLSNDSAADYRKWFSTHPAARDATK